MWGRDDPYQVGSRPGRTLMQDDVVVDLEDPSDIIGYILGCVSAMFYVMSRVPQIIKNVCITHTLNLEAAHGTKYHDSGVLGKTQD